MLLLCAQVGINPQQSALEPSEAVLADLNGNFFQIEKETIQKKREWMMLCKYYL